MNLRKLLFVLYIAVLIATIAFVATPLMTIHAQCGDPAAGQPPCTPPPSGGGGGGKIPTSVHVFPPLSLIPTSTPGPQVISPNTGGGPSGALPAVQNPNPGSSSGKSGNGFPGPLGMIIAILIIVVCFAGGLLLFRSRRGGGSPNANKVSKGPGPINDGSSQFGKYKGSTNADDLDLNPQPLPPKGMGDGSSQFVKEIKTNKIGGSGGKQQ